jgi:hypothetical protein
MKRRGLLFLLMTALVLAGCGRLSVVPALDIQAGFNPTAFGFEVTENGTEVAAHTVIFTARAGSMGATVIGYEIEYYTKDGAPMIINDHILRGKGALNVDVPPGIRCDERLANPSHRCTVNDTNIRYVPMSSEPLNNFVSLDAPIVDRMLELYQVGDYADVYFELISDNNRSSRIGPFEVPLVIPVRP